MERAIAKWERKQWVVEAPLVTKKANVQTKTPLKKEKSAKVKEAKSPQAVLNAKHKEQHRELKMNQKAEREVFKAERKAEKEIQKHEIKEVGKHQKVDE